jgi:hypothetical protein
MNCQKSFILVLKIKGNFNYEKNNTLKKNKNPIQPVSGTKVPRFAGPSTFARLPELRDVESCDVANVDGPANLGTLVPLTG